jgi:hypothetical protein
MKCLGYQWKGINNQIELWRNGTHWMEIEQASIGFKNGTEKKIEMYFLTSALKMSTYAQLQMITFYVSKNKYLLF